MALEPVEATLIAASVGSATSTAAVLVTHLLTRARDRGHKVWDRRMDTYKLLLRSRRDLAFARREFLNTGKNPAELVKADRELKESGLIAAELEMFGSTAVNAVNMAANIAFTQWAAAASEWHKLNGRPSADAEAHSKADEKWEQIKSITETADLVDNRLAEAIKTEADFKVPFKLERWRRPFRRDAIKR